MTGSDGVSTRVEKELSQVQQDITRLHQELQALDRRVHAQFVEFKEELRAELKSDLKSLIEELLGAGIAGRGILGAPPAGGVSATSDCSGNGRFETGENDNRPYKFKCPKFDGTSFKDWRAEVEQYFEAEMVPATAKVRTVMLHLEGAALHWHQFFVRDWGSLNTISWETYLSHMEERFAPRAFASPNDDAKKTQNVDLGNGSDVVYVPRFLANDVAWKFFNYLDNHIPWTRPTLRVFGRSCIQSRDICYVASAGLPDLIYGGYQPCAYSWDDFPPLKDILDAVHKMLPGSTFNSLLLNRYKGGNDYVGWHSDDEKLYGSTPEIASVSFGCERDFYFRKKSLKSSQERSDEKPPMKRIKRSSQDDQHRFMLKHGSLLVMRGNTQRDWIHSIPKCATAKTTRINLTFRLVL